MRNGETAGRRHRRPLADGVWTLAHPVKAPQVIAAYRKAAQDAAREPGKIILQGIAAAAETDELALESSREWKGTSQAPIPWARCGCTPSTSCRSCAVSSMMNVVICLLVLSALITLAIYRFRSARRSRADQAGWEAFRRSHGDLNGELGRIWYCR